MARSAAAPRPAGSAPPPLQGGTVEMLVALAVEEERERRRKLAAAADKGLLALEALHEELLTGDPGAERLRDLLSWADGLAPTQEPVLAELLSAIELRARVELAKWERDQA